jgi:glucan phosphoethanolaminetransferase (alkaline phosphatase superfamily)
MTHHPFVAQALYYCIVAIVPTRQPRKPQTCNIIIIIIIIIVVVVVVVVIVYRKPEGSS